MDINNINFPRISFITIIIALGTLLIVYIATDLVVEFWWFKSMGYTQYFALREGYRDTITLIVTLLLTVIFYVNFRLVSLFCSPEKKLNIVRDHSGLTTRITKKLFNKYYFFLSFILSVPVLIPVYTNWEAVLLFFFSNPSGVLDPAYGKDISFYFFSYPVYQLIQNELLLVFSILMVVVASMYGWAYKKQKTELRILPKPARIHLTVLIIAIVFLQSWSISLERIELLYEDRHRPVFFGPGLAEMRFYLPLIWLTFLAFLGAAFSAIYYIHKKQGHKLIFVFTLAYLAFLSVREFNFIPALVDRFYVQANPVKAEGRYMKFNIDSTLKAFGLDQVTKIQYPASSTLTPGVSAEISKILYNIPLWESGLLKDVYQQLQGLRPYYEFSAIATDQYQIGGDYQQVNIAARELSMQKLPAETNSWENHHLNYTHGYGVVITPAAQNANEQKKWLVRDLSLSTEHENLKITQPEIYYGLGDYKYAVVPNASPGSLAKAKELSSDYQGTGGLKISSLSRKLLMAVFLREESLILSSSVTPESRLLMRRNINERIHAIAPFLQLEPNPVPAIINHKIYWVVDAYTTTQRYPLVRQVRFPFSNTTLGYDPEAHFNYVRNSVKIIVDAYNGTVDFYIVDNTDPIVSAYRSAYPTLFKDASQMPNEFVQHLSYPVGLFNLQMQIYARYHYPSPSVFYQQNKRLEIAKINNQPSQPIFLTIDPFEGENLPPSEQQKFTLVSILTPYKRENLAMIGVAGCLLKDNCKVKYSADIFAYQFPKDLQIDGPAQITALTNQKPEISRQFTLWGQRGSSVIKGSMIIIPVKEQILYIQPIYLVATSETKFPQLARVIVVMNQQVAMDTTLELAYKTLEQKLLDREKSLAN